LLYVEKNCLERRILMSIYYESTKLASNKIAGDTLPIGSMIPYPSDTIPEGWLLCNGQAVSRTVYSELFAILGTTHGAGDGSSTFNVPNIKGRTIVGRDPADTDFDTLGETGGSKTHTLNLNEIPSHIHGALVSDQDSGGTFGLTVVLPEAHAAFNNNYINSAGGGQAHNNLQPLIVENYIIKAKQSSGVVATVVDNLTSTSTINALSANQGKVLASGTLKSKIITATRDASGATGSVAYTGVGFRPSAVECMMCVDGTLYQSKGVCDSSLTNRCHFQSAANTYYEVVNIVCYSNQASWAQRGSITAFGDDGFTIGWIKDGTPTAGTLKLVFICYR
jgi:microcystin-dependent protein